MMQGTPVQLSPSDAASTPVWDSQSPPLSNPKEAMTAIIVVFSLLGVFALYILTCSNLLCYKLWKYRGSGRKSQERLHRPIKTKPIFTQAMKDATRASMSGSITLAGSLRTRSEARSLGSCEDFELYTYPSRASGRDEILTTDENVVPSTREDSILSLQIHPFVYDDCGDGTHFPGVPFATEPEPVAGAFHRVLSPERAELQRLGLMLTPRESWLALPDRETFLAQHTVRTWLLKHNREACVHVCSDAMDACAELLETVAGKLTSTYPNDFRMITKEGQKYVRNKLTGEDFAIEGPPWKGSSSIERCARMSGADFMFWVRGGLNGRWYLQAAATCFPSGYDVNQYVDKSAEAIGKDKKARVLPLGSLSDTLDLASDSNLATPTTILTESRMFLQRPPPSSPTTPTLVSKLHLTTPSPLLSPTDALFALSNARSQDTDLLIRTQTTSYRRLSCSEAVVMSTRTSLIELSSLSERNRKAIAREIRREI